VYGLKNVPAVLVGDIVKGSPAEKAGLQISDIITKVNGQPLERGDDPTELPGIMTRKIQRMKVGDTVTLSVIHQKGDTPKDITITLEQRPKEITDAKRYFAEDIGLVVRESVFFDNYARKLDADRTGVVVAGLKRQAAAAAAGLVPQDLILQMDGKLVTTLDQFSKAYEEIRKDKPNDRVVLEVSHLQDGKQATINIEPPQSGEAPAGGM
jgi:serine protease Do